ncbi:MAG: hypothetical protein ACYDAQ_12745 [Mycobacteriales bacterium]
MTGAKAVKPRVRRAGQLPTNSALLFGGGGNTSSTATLQLSRKWGGIIDRHREWQILIDGDVVGSIADQKTVELSVEPGRHAMRLSSGRHFSPERSFEAADGQVVSFSCRGAMAWPMYVAALIKPDLWISLKQD